MFLKKKSWLTSRHIQNQYSFSYAFIAWLDEEKMYPFFLFFGLASFCCARARWRERSSWTDVSLNMQPLCCSQCVVQWCSQTPKHVLLNLYDCTYRILFYNLCKTSLRMSHDSSCGRGNVDVNIYFIAFHLPFFCWYVLSLKFYFGHSTWSFSSLFLQCLIKLALLGTIVHRCFIYWIACIVDHMFSETLSFVCCCWLFLLLN